MNQLIKILAKQNFWGELKARSIGYHRTWYVERLLAQKDAPEVSAAVGVRRSGKSTILKQVLSGLIADGVPAKNTLYIDLEEPEFTPIPNDKLIFQILEAYQKEISKTGKKYIVFDEVQNVEGWEKVLRNLVDNRKDLKVYLTGSSAALFASDLGTKLSGRYLETEIFPVSWDEFKLFSKKKSSPDLLQRYIALGGFPRAVLEKDETIRKQLLQDYFNSILLRDIIERYSIRNAVELKELVLYLFANNSNLASIPQFSKLLGLPPDTIKRYYDYIQTAYLGFFVSHFSYSLKQQIYNPKKFYCVDLGLVQQVSFSFTDNMGKLFENLVFLELRRRYRDIFYWKGKGELDFLVRKGTKPLFLINACWSIDNEETLHRELKSLKEAMLEFDMEEGFLVTKNTNRRISTEEGNIRVVEFKKFARLISSGALDRSN